MTNTVTLPIDLNPGALATDAFVALNVAANPDGSLPGTPTQLFPDSATRTVGVRLDKGPGHVCGRGSRQGLHREQPAGFGPWATPAAIRAFGPFDLKSFRWTDSRGPSYRFNATIMETSTTGRVNIAIGRGTKGKYKSFGTAKIRKHAFSKRFRLSRGKWRIRFKYKGNARSPAGSRCGRFEITRRTVLPGRDLPLLRGRLAAPGRRTSVLPRPRGKTDVRPRATGAALAPVSAAPRPPPSRVQPRS